MRKRAQSCSRPLGIVVGMAIVLLVMGWSGAGAEPQSRERPQREDTQPPERYERIVPVSRDDVRVGDDWLVLRLGDQRFHWNRFARLFVPRQWVDHRFRRRPPVGTVFIDPFTGRRFDDLLRYRRYLEDEAYPPVLDIIDLRPGSHRRHRESDTPRR